MPFFNHSMVQGMRKTANDVVSEKHSLKIRSVPGATDVEKVISKSADPSITVKYTQKIAQRKLLFTRSLLRSQIEQLNSQNGAIPVSQAQNLFKAFSIDFNTKIHEDTEHVIYPARNKLSPEFIMMASVIPLKGIDPKNSFYLKILRHLGRKHPYIIVTWEIFHDDKNIYIFQEFVTRGNLITYLETSEVDEGQACFWAKQIFRALDFLGDNGISHRNITPHHLVVKAMGAEMWIKLTGFKNSMIYWNVVDNDVNFCPCLPITQQKVDGPNFQAPEVYGNENEYFDPILADTWSFGANLFFALAKFYPYNVEFPHEDLDEEIWHNIQKISKVSEECQKFLFSLMRSNANDRIPFDFIDKDDWISRSYAQAASRTSLVPSVTRMVSKTQSMTATSPGQK